MFLYLSFFIDLCFYLLKCTNLKSHCFNWQKEDEANNNGVDEDDSDEDDDTPPRLDVSLAEISDISVEII